MTLTATSAGGEARRTSGSDELNNAEHGTPAPRGNGPAWLPVLGEEPPLRRDAAQVDGGIVPACT